MNPQSGEFDLIRLLAMRLEGDLPRGTIGIGDDAAGVPDGDGWLLLTCDSAVDGCHFRIGETPWADLGWRVATANVSDVVACGGWPTHALISLSIPAHVDNDALEVLYDGIQEAAREYGFVVVGGNVSSGNDLVVDCFLMGRTPRFVARKGAQPGDLLAVSGTLGDGAAGLELLGSGGRTATGQELVRRYLRPRARTDLVKGLRVAASAAIDISDGLSSECHHLAVASGVRLEVESAKLPASPELMAHATNTGTDPFPWMLHGGEGYQILCTYPPANAGAFAGQDLTPIGRVVSGEGVFLDDAPLVPRGWDHLTRLGR